MYTLKSIFEQTVSRYPGREALVCPQRGLRYTYKEWEQQVNKLSNAMLVSGIAKGDRISTYLGNTAELPTVLLAAAKIGAVFNPVNYQLSSAELAFILNDSESRLLVFESTSKDRVIKALPFIKTVKIYLCIDDDVPEFAVHFHRFLDQAGADRPPVRVAENDWCSIIYTSGTTGKPKGVIHRHRNILDHNMCMIESQKLTYNDRGLSVAPLYHSAELHCFFLPRMHTGATNVLIRHFEQDLFWKTLARERITVMFGDPPIWSRILQNMKVEAFQDTRLLAYGGAAMPVEIYERLSGILGPGIEFIQYYGMTEMGPAVTVNYPGKNTAKAGSVGRALLNHEIRVVKPCFSMPADPEDVALPNDCGEVLVRGTGMMQGYYNHPEVTAGAFYGGWYHTGDLGRLDDDGYLWIVDRVDDVIVPGVDNVYPGEIERVLQEHPEVAEVAVVGMPSKDNHQVIITAFVVPKGHNTSARDLENYLKESDKIARYKHPQRYYFVPELPKTATGKVMKYLLKKYK